MTTYVAANDHNGAFGTLVEGELYDIENTFSAHHPWVRAVEAGVLVELGRYAPDLAVALSLSLPISAAESPSPSPKKARGKTQPKAEAAPETTSEDPQSPESGDSGAGTGQTGS